MFGYIRILDYIIYIYIVGKIEQHQGDGWNQLPPNAKKMGTFFQTFHNWVYPGCLALHRSDLALQLLRWQCHPDTSGEGIHETLAKVASMNRPETGISAKERTMS